MILLLASGYAVALLNLYLTYEHADGQPGLSVADLKRSFHSPRGRTLMAAKVDGGSMAQYLPDPQERARLLNWLQDGAQQDTYKTIALPIFTAHCLECHSPGGIMEQQPFNTYQALAPVIQVDRGEPVPVWARVAHTHLQALGILFGAIGLILCGTRIHMALKSWLIALPFLALFVDFIARFLARFSDFFVYLMAGTGAIAPGAFAIMIYLTIAEMWFPRLIPAFLLDAEFLPGQKPNL